MKFTLTITDMTAEDVYDVISSVEGTDTTVEQTEVVTQPEQAAGFAKTTNIELDADGLPWDERIHAGSKTKTAKGVWKKRRGVQPVTITEVEAELRNAPAETIEMFPENPVEQVEQTPPFVQTLTAPSEPVVQRDFKTFINRINSLIMTGERDMNYVTDVINRINQGFGFNITALTDIANTDEMIEYAHKCLDVDAQAVAGGQ